MKELKVYVPQDGPYGLEPEEGGEPVEEETCYLKSDVDAVIAKLKAKNERLNKELNEWIKSAANRPIVIGNLRKEIAELREATRWRKCSEELPTVEDTYICAYKNKNKDDGIWLVDEAVWDGKKWSYKFDFWEDIIYWQFKPKAPEADK